MANMQPASRDYIEQAARRYHTTVAAAFRRALGIKVQKRKRRRRRRHKAPYEPSERELEACRKQRHGVTWHEQ